MAKIMFTCALLFVAVNSFAMEGKQKYEEISKTMEKYKDVKPKSKWTGNTGLYYEHEKQNTYEAMYPFLSGDFKRSQSRWSFNYQLLKKYSGSDTTYDRTRLQAGIKYKANQSWGNIGAGIAYRDQIQGKRGTTFERIHAWRPNLFGKFNFTKKIYIHTNLKFSFESRQKSNGGDTQSYEDIDHELLGGIGYDFSKKNKIRLDYFYEHEDFEKDVETKEGQIRFKYAYMFDNEITVSPFIWYGLGMEHKDGDGNHDYDVNNTAYGLSYTQPLHKRLTFLFTGYWQEEEWKGKAGNTDQDYNYWNIVVGFNYAY